MILPIIFSSLLGIFLILYVIGYCKNVIVLQRLVLPLVLPCSVGIVLPFVLAKMPDSFHIMLFTSVAFFLAELSVLIDLLPFKKKQFFSNFFYFLSNAGWIYVFYTIFYLYNFSQGFAIAMAVIYLGLFIFTCVKLVIKSIKQIFWLLLLMSLSFVLNFIALSTVIYTRSIYSLVLFLGSALLVSFNFVSLSARVKADIKNSKLILTLLFIFGELCVYASSALMMLL